MIPPKKGAFAKFHLSFLLLGLAAFGTAQTIDVQEAVRRGVAASPAVKAAEARVAAAREHVRGAKAGFNPQIELTPGVGFTNGNTALSQQIDIGGVRSSQAALAQAELLTEEANLQATRQLRAIQVAVAYFELVRAKAELAAAAEHSKLARELVALVRRRVEVGEAAEVQATRADIEAQRIEQEQVRARGAVAAHLLALRLLLSDETLAEAAVPAEFPALMNPPELQATLGQALSNRAEVSRARGLLSAARSGVSVARAQSRPSLVAGVASEVWSLDREPFDSDNIGFQAFLSFPLFDRGSLRADVRRAESLVVAAESEELAVQQQVRAEVALALTELQTRSQIAANYRASILPQSEKLVQTTTAGYETGLTTLIDVLDAQRTARLARSEYLSVLFQAFQAELDLWRATGNLAPQPQETTK